MTQNAIPTYELSNSMVMYPICK